MSRPFPTILYPVLRLSWDTAVQLMVFTVGYQLYWSHGAWLSEPSLPIYPRHIAQLLWSREHLQRHIPGKFWCPISLRCPSCLYEQRTVLVVRELEPRLIIHRIIRRKEGHTLTEICTYPRYTFGERSLLWCTDLPQKMSTSPELRVANRD